MIKTTIYRRDELHSGTCDRCGSQSDEIIYSEDGSELCLDCIEDEIFYKETMEGI